MKKYIRIEKVDVQRIIPHEVAIFILQCAIIYSHKPLTSVSYNGGVCEVNTKIGKVCPSAFKHYLLLLRNKRIEQEQIPRIIDVECINQKRNY